VALVALNDRKPHARAARASSAGSPAGSQTARAAVTAIEFAISLIASRSLPEKKLREKIASRYDADETDKAILRMRELGLADDVAWAERFARDRFERGDKGRNRIRGELMRLGIAKTSIDAALERVVDADAERDKAAAVLERMRSRLVRVGDDLGGSDGQSGQGCARSRDPAARIAAEKAKNRLFRRMLARGYPAALVRDLLDVS
jgi:SOS response regulatory protein OraA/RecX